MSNPTNDEQRRADQAQKLEFARLVFEAGPTADTYQIAFDMFPTNPNRAVLAGAHWRIDPTVLEELTRLKSNQVVQAETLPTQVDLARNIWLKMQACNEPDSYVKLAKLYAEVQGMIKKPSDSNQTSQVFRPVMIVRDHGSDSDWEAKMLRNQNQLQDDGLREIAGARLED